jgi:hypothetical protein
VVVDLGLVGAADADVISGGTPSFLAPEAIMAFRAETQADHDLVVGEWAARPADHDSWACAATVFEILTGEWFDVSSVVSVRACRVVAVFAWLQGHALGWSLTCSPDAMRLSQGDPSL